jgi:two-component system nitrogen regulation sensor histidine kinase GlnL
VSTFLLVSSILNLAASAFLSFAVFAASGHSVLRTRFLVFLFCITCWTLGYFFWQVSDSAEMAYWSCVSLIVPATFIPVTFYHLALCLADSKTRIFLYFGYVWATLACLTIPFGGLVSAVPPKLSFDYWPQAGPFLYLVVVLFVVYVVLISATLMAGAKRYVGIRASQMRFVLGSAAIGFVGGSTNFPLWYDISLPPYGNVIVFVYLLMVGYGIYNQHIKGVSVDVFKSFILILLTASFSMFYVLGAAILLMLRNEDVSLTFYWVQGTSCFFIVSFLFWIVPKLRKWIEHLLDLLFRKDGLSAVAQLEAFTAEMSAISDTGQIFRKTCEALYRIFDLSGVALYFRADFEPSLTCSYQMGKFPSDPSESGFDLCDPLIAQFDLKKECIDPDQIFDEMMPGLEARLIELKRLFQLSFIVPIFAGKKLYGLIILGKTKGGAFWTLEQSSLLFAVGAQVGLNLQARELERKSNEVDKLVALGTMAAGLSHEIRNPLVSVQTFASLVASNKPLNRIGDEFKQVLLRDVKRISNIVEGVAMFSENRKGNMLPTPLRDVIDNSCNIYREVMLAKGVTLEVDLDWDGEVLANLDQLSQVFNNLIENSIQALSDVADRRLRIAAKQITIGTLQSWVEVSFSDSGSGVPRDIRDRIFDPFITSKDTGKREAQEGMGLGLAISKRIIENHDGAISVSESQWGGAKFIVSLRVFEASNA